MADITTTADGVGDITSVIANMVAGNERRFIEIRRELHQYPELAFEEVRTAASSLKL